MTATISQTALLPLLQTIAAATERRDRPASLPVVEGDSRRGEMPPLHLHAEDEAFHVLEGSVTIYAGGETVLLEAGEGFHVAAGMPHTHRVESSRARYLSASLVPSAGRYEDFLRAVARPLDSPGPAAARSRPSSEESVTLSAIATACDVTVLGPPGALPEARAAQAA
ncbi:MAG: cupin domain-containing protein [Actinobacteria bacterium]|nr:cupin domain-containing protein [Actinomycetota bacterium]